MVAMAINFFAMLLLDMRLTNMSWVLILAPVFNVLVGIALCLSLMYKSCVELYHELKRILP